jgi:hypothetical protein
MSRPAAVASRSITITVDDEGFSAVTAEARVEGAWTMFRNATLTRSHLFLRFRSRKVMCVPRRCFGSPEAESAFIDVVAAHLRVKGLDATSLTPVSPG